MRYEFKGFIIMEAETETEAQRAVEDALDAINKNPDGLRVFQDDSAPIVEEDS